MLRVMPFVSITSTTGRPSSFATAAFESDPSAGTPSNRPLFAPTNVATPAWADDPLTQEAVAALRDILEKPDPLTRSVRFGAGQGVLCNNVLHERTESDVSRSEPSKRTVYRVRFSNRVKGT